LRALADIAKHFIERGPDHIGLCSGGSGGCYSIELFRGDVSSVKYRQETRVFQARA